jgi:dihydrofolate reductase
MEAIYATDSKNGLSKDGIIPWKSKKDMEFFMNKTKNNIVIMGRKTYFSIPNGPLKERLNIVITNEPNKYIVDDSIDHNNVIFTSNINIYKNILLNKDKYLKLYNCLKIDFTIYIIGGKEIYEKFIPICSKIWVTKFKKHYNCDLFFNYNYYSIVFTPFYILNADFYIGHSI